MSVNNQLSVTFKNKNLLTESKGCKSHSRRLASVTGTERNIINYSFRMFPLALPCC